jgi:hypothetical protein
MLVAAGAALAWGIGVEQGFRPSALGALVAATAIPAAALMWPLRISTALVVVAILIAVVLIVVPAGGACDPPIAEFVPHALEDAAGPHVHDRCQLESDRRSVAGLVLAAGAGGAGTILLRRWRGSK